MLRDVRRSLAGELDRAADLDEQIIRASRQLIGHNLWGNSNFAQPYQVGQ